MDSVFLDLSDFIASQMGHRLVSYHINMCACMCKTAMLPAEAHLQLFAQQIK